MKLFDVKFSEDVGVVDEAPKTIQLIFLFSNEKGNHITRIPVSFRTKEDRHIGVIRKLHNFIDDVVASEIE